VHDPVTCSTEAWSRLRAGLRREHRPRARRGSTPRQSSAQPHRAFWRSALAQRALVLHVFVTVNIPADATSARTETRLGGPTCANPDAPAAAGDAGHYPASKMSSCVQIAIDLHIADKRGMEQTGVGRYAVESTAALCRARPDWRFKVLTNRPELIDEPNADTVTTPLPTRRSSIRVAWLHGWSRWETRQLHADLWLGTAFTLPFWWRGHAVVTIHDLMFLEMRLAYARRLNAVYATRATRWAARHADRIICGSSETVDRLQRHFGIPASKVEIVPYGVSDAFFQARASGRNRPDQYVLFVGTFEARKGLAELHRALKLVNTERLTPVRLVLAGRPGWGVDETLQGLRRDPDVQLCIGPSDAELAELYAGALALAYPSHAEGFGLPVAEAMAAGTPVVASDLSCIREFAEDAPVYVRVGDAESLARNITRLVDNPRERDARVARGRELADGLRWSALGERTAMIVDGSLA
jgi:glycosyltransferase involved in cell wall biosynthesis